MAPSYNRLARRHPNVFFLDVAYSSKNTDFFEALNVPYVPYCHIYSSNQLIDEMKMSKSNWSLFEGSVKNLIKGYCNLDDFEQLQVETKSLSI